MADFRSRRRWTARLPTVRRTVDEEIHPSSGWTNDFPGFHCLLVNLPGFEENDIKIITYESGIIVVSGRRKVDDDKQEHFEKAFNVPEDGDVRNITKIFDGATLRVRIPKVAKPPEKGEPSSAAGASTSTDISQKDGKGSNIPPLDSIEEEDDEPVVEEINPYSEWTNEIPGFHCFLICLPGFEEDDIKLNVEKDGIIVVSGRRKTEDGKSEHFIKTFSVPKDGNINNIQMIFKEYTLGVLILKIVDEEINPSRWTRDCHGFHCLLVNLPGFTGDDIKLNVDESEIIVISGRRVDDRKQEHFEIMFNMKEDGNVKNIQKIFNVDTLAVFVPKLVEEDITPSSKWTDDIPGSHCLILKLPGFKEDDIKLNVDEHRNIVISGRRKVGDDKREQFVKTFNDVPEDGDVENIQTVFEEDTLRVSIPKLVVEEINPSSSGWIDDIPGYHCVLITLPGFIDADIKVNVNKPGIITVSGRRKVDDEKQEHFEKTFDVPKDGDIKNVTNKFDGAILRVFIPKPVKEEIVPSSGWTNDIIGSHCLLVNLPVFNKDDMKMEVDKSGVIVVSGKRQVGDRKEEHFIKTFYVPDNRDMENVSETFEGDTLKVCIPKKTMTENGELDNNNNNNMINNNNNNNINNDDKKESNDISAFVPDEIPGSNSSIMANDKVAPNTIGTIQSKGTKWGLRTLFKALITKTKKE